MIQMMILMIILILILILILMILMMWTTHDARRSMWHPYLVTRPIRMVRFDTTTHGIRDVAEARRTRWVQLGGSVGGLVTT